MKKSKFVGLRDGLWECIGYMVSDVQGARCKKKLDDMGKKARTKSPGSRQYDYEWCRPTSDGEAMKYITLSAYQAKRVYKGLATVEEYAKKKEAKQLQKQSRTYKERVSYSFGG
jgi:hypothetical protein